MSIKTKTYEDRVLNAMRGTALTAWTPYAGLLTAVADAEAGTVTEIAYTGYARQAVTFGAPAAGTVTNSGVVSFGQMTAGAGGTAMAVGYYSAATGGELRYVVALDTPKAIAVGDTPEFGVGDLELAEM